MTEWFEQLRKLFLIYIAVAFGTALAFFIIFSSAKHMGWLP